MTLIVMYISCTFYASGTLRAGLRIYHTWISS